MNSSPTRSSVYSFRNADEVVRAFMRKYARVLLFMCKIMGIPIERVRNSLIYLYMYQNAKWNVTREVLKRLDKREEMDYLSHMERSDRAKYLTFVRTMAEDWLIDNEKLQ